MLSRRVVVLFLVASVSGCSSTKTTPDASGANLTSTQSTATRASSARAGDDCTPRRSRCIYKGAYEPGEKDYAEQQAKRLNLAEYERLRRSFGK
jgi:uncharacterized protein YceK